MTRINVNLHPSGGFFFKEVDGSIHKGASWLGVIKKVTRYRVRNGFPVGNPEQEVHAQACARNPSLCYKDDPVTRQQTKNASLKGRVLSWFSELRKRKSEILFTDQGVATARANICVTCPYNTALSEGCSTCKRVVREFRGEILGRRPADNRVQACAVLGNDIPTAAWLDEPPLDRPDIPAHCWRKRKP